MALPSAGHEPNVPTVQGRKTIHLPVAETYNRWAATYDTDGNILQALDSMALSRTMLPLLFRSIPAKMNGNASELYVTDLGCGTGRADLLFVSALQAQGNRWIELLLKKGYKSIHLTGVDSAIGMLDIARNRVPSNPLIHENLVLNIQYGVWDINTPTEEVVLLGRNGDDMSVTKAIVPADAVISTLVLEHIEINPFFSAAKRLLRPGGMFLITNMHSDMGNKVFGDPSQYKDQPLPTGAGFVDTATNTKVRAAVDYAHPSKDVIAAADKAGFELVDNLVEEVAVEPWMLERSLPDGSTDGNSTPLLGIRGKKWAGIKCWYGMIFRLRT